MESPAAATLCAHPRHFVVDLVKRSPIFVRARSTVRSALARSWEGGTHYLVVLEESDVVGVCCRCDLMPASGSVLVGDIMSTPAISVDDQSTTAEAARVMRTYRVGCLPIVDWAEHLRGVVTRTDLLRDGSLRPSEIAHCLSCGATHGLVDDSTLSNQFCRQCLEQGRAPADPWEELYFVTGGGD